MTHSKKYLLFSDFDQTLSFHDSGRVLSSLLGVTDFEERVAGLATWLNKELRFPNWEAISHDKTKISDWAQSTGAPMDKMYATEHREGGTIALGKDIPNIPREKLNVLPESEWQTQKDKIVLESWFEHVSQASR